MDKNKYFYLSVPYMSFIRTTCYPIFSKMFILFYGLETSLLILFESYEIDLFPPFL